MDIAKAIFCRLLALRSSMLSKSSQPAQRCRRVSIATSPYQVNEQAKAANPTGRIPSLIRADGPTLYDSRVITRYLDAKAAAGMYPEARLWDVLTVEATGDSMMDSAVSMSYELRLRPQEKVSSEWTDAQWSKVMGGCDALQSQWMDLLNGPLTMAHISIACALGYLDLRSLKAPQDRCIRVSCGQKAEMMAFERALPRALACCTEI